MEASSLYCTTVTVCIIISTSFRKAETGKNSKIGNIRRMTTTRTTMKNKIISFIVKLQLHQAMYMNVRACILYSIGSVSVDSVHGI